MCKIKIVDSMMGTGKTSWAIDKMKNDNKNNYVYITPYLSEIQRIKTNIDNKKFYEPVNIGNGKLDSLHNLLLKNKNIASTHALFKMATDETKELIKANSYILILDEVMDVIEQIPLKKDDLKLLLDNKLISIDRKNKNIVKWNEDKQDFSSKYDDIKQMVLNNNVYMVNNTLLMWTFPVEIFQAFKEIYVLTYLFDGQIQRYYYDLYNVKYEYNSIHKVNDTYVLGDYIKEYDMIEIKNRIHILDDKINNIGDDEFSLSSSWFTKDKNKLLVTQLKNNTYNYFTHKIKGKSKDNMWTTFKKQRSKLTGKGYMRGFVSLTARATNDYADKSNLAYLSNIFINPLIKQFFTDRNIKVSENIYALSELIQWIYRSRIRKNNNEIINLYIPSSRMRNLLNEWLGN
ncbi:MULTISPECIES: hypothetical protein [unclassified Clostridium]|uniref:hypothetical protein n=1 Tax=unclassified Clostridium TaxID=2614128 RepID=UPI00207AAAF1|nr:MULTISPECIES: hypothetical protein [unclassified Clostridium]